MHLIEDNHALKRCRFRIEVMGMSTRATLALQRASRVRAASQGRDYVLPDDVKQLAVPVLAHRLLLDPQARARGTPAARIVEEIMSSVPAPVE